MVRNPTVLVTGFGPFPGVDVNASARFSGSLAKFCGRRIGDARVVFGVLATQWRDAPDALKELKARYHPDVVLHFGVSQSARGFVLERVARNECDDCVDACGAVASKPVVVAGAPGLLRSTFPAELIASRLGARAIPVAVSDDAGSYLCNAVLFHSLLDLQERTVDGRGFAPIVGFVHLPRDLGTSGCAMTWRSALVGGLDIVNACCEAWAEGSHASFSGLGPRTGV